MDRTILHSDLNSFYASVEMMLNPSLKNKAVAVGGSTEDRHGIILAKSELAKKAGVKTGMVNWEAKRLCPELVILPPQYDQYMKYSKLAREIYERYTDKVEPYGMDECWLDVTGSVGLFGDGNKIAYKIKECIKKEIGLTVSIGVSFNKIFAKLGSDMKKPDAVTVITKDNFKEKVWVLPVEDLFFVGRATKSKLNAIGIKTIGELAELPKEILKHKFGKNGEMLFLYANGLDISKVMPCGYETQIKSIGHGITCTSDLENNDEAFKVILELSQDIGHKLKIHGLTASGIQITIKNIDLFYQQWQTKMEKNTQSAVDIANASYDLFKKSYKWNQNIRAITVRAINLISAFTPQQYCFFIDTNKKERKEKLDVAIDEIRGRFGKQAVTYATLMGDIKMPGQRSYELIMPGMAGR